MCLFHPIPPRYSPVQFRSSHQVGLVEFVVVIVAVVVVAVVVVVVVVVVAVVVLMLSLLSCPAPWRLPLLWRTKLKIFFSSGACHLLFAPKVLLEDR